MRKLNKISCCNPCDWIADYIIPTFLCELRKNPNNLPMLCSVSPWAVLDRWSMDNNNIYEFSDRERHYKM